MGRGPEARFQDGLHTRLYELFPGCKIFKMDQHQGISLTLFVGNMLFLNSVFIPPYLSPSNLYF